MSPRVISLFAGIGGFDLGFQRAGFEIVAHIEKDANCRKLLAAKFPAAIALDDVCTTGAHNLPACDVLCGGFPCQDLSIAGKRAGLAGARSGLFYEFIRIASELGPQWIILENVPGLISSKGGDDLRAILSELYDLGYIVDIEILDAQYFGLAQRRKRVFICAQSIESILNQKTISSGLTIAQCLAEILALSLGVLSARSLADCEPLDCDVKRPALSLKQRMKLFSLEKTEAVSKLQSNLDALLPSSEAELENLESILGLISRLKIDSRDTKQPEAQGQDRMGDPLRSIATSWNSILAESLRIARECITSTSTSETTELTIFTCAVTLLRTASLITQSMESSPCFLSAASSNLTAIRAFINYARQATEDIFTGPKWICAWHDFLQQAVSLCATLASLRVTSFGQILPVSEGLRGHPAPSRKAREEIAGKLGGSYQSGGFRTADLDNNRAFVIQRELAHSVTCHAAKGGDPTTDNYVVAHTLRGEGFDASEDGTGRGTPLVVAFAHQAGGNQSTLGYDPKSGTSPALSVGQTPAVAFDLRGREGGAQFEGPHDTANIRAASGGSSRSYVAGSAVRRLTPRECERIQGFQWRLPDGSWSPDWTAGFSDSTRYKMLGNSAPPPVVEWLAWRIRAVLKTLNQPTQ